MSDSSVYRALSLGHEVLGESGRAFYAINRKRPLLKGAFRLARPKDALIDGVQILEAVLLPRGFHFQFDGEGSGSGGDFARGAFVREDRRLEIHFRRSLGLVRYHIGEKSASHESYMRELGVWDQCRYPGFSNDPRNEFDELAHDLSYAADFLVGSASTLRQAAAKEAANTAAREADAMFGDVGDKRKVDQMRRCFWEEQYSEVVRLARELKYPAQISESERKMVEIAQKRIGRRGFFARLLHR